MIIKGAQVLPHGLINNVEEKLGLQGEKLAEYVSCCGTGSCPSGWTPIIRRFCTLTYTVPSALFGNHNYSAMADYLARLEELAKPPAPAHRGPHGLRLRPAKSARGPGRPDCRAGPAWNSGRAGGGRVCNTLEDIKLFADHKAGHMVQIKTPDLGSIHNTIEAVLYCKAKGIGAYQGGTCNETDRSAQVCVHCAMLPTGTDPGQAGHGRRRGVHDCIQRNAAYFGAAPREKKPGSIVFQIRPKEFSYADSSFQ